MKRKSAPSHAAKSDELPQQVADAIDQLPLLKMVASIELSSPGQSDPSDPVGAMKSQAEHLIKKLEVFAKLGNEKAVRSLRDIGNSSAQALRYLITDEEEEKDCPENPSLFMGSMPPLVRLSGDFSALNKILAECSESPASEDPGTVPQLRSFHCAEETDFLVDVIDALHWRDDRATVVRNELLAPPGQETAALAKIALSNPAERLRIIWNTTGACEPTCDSVSKAAAAEVVLHDEIRRRIEARLSQLGKEAASAAVRRQASESLTWPVTTSAIEELQRQEQAIRDELKLGSGIPFRLKRKGTPGRPRDFKQGSPSAFALEVCVALHTQREMLAPETDAERLRISEKLAELENTTLPAIREAEKQGLIDRFKKSRALNYRWRLAAALMTDFPSPEALAGSEKAFDEWHRVAMLRAESDCRGDWERYPWWPQWVVKRARGRGKKRSVKEAVSDCLQRGMQNIRR